jgi:plastocyanin
MRRLVPFLIAIVVTLPAFSAELHIATPAEELKPHVVFVDKVPPVADGFNAAAAKTFIVEASQWEFTFQPRPFVVNVGDSVTLEIRSSDVTHGFFLERFMNDGVTLPPNQTRPVTFVANTAGTFTYFCTESGCGAGHVSMAGVFTVNAAQAVAPTISSFIPTSGPIAGGNVVVINGTGFQSNATVRFGSLDGLGVNVDSDTRITAFAPAQGAGGVNITVRNPDGQSVVSAAQYTYEAPLPPAPTIATFVPTSGPSAGGTGVVITGTGFGAGTTVSFGGIAATSVTINSSTQLTAIVPSHSIGPVNITVRNAEGQSVVSTATYSYVPINRDRRRAVKR